MAVMAKTAAPATTAPIWTAGAAFDPFALPTTTAAPFVGPQAVVVGHSVGAHVVLQVVDSQAVGAHVVEHVVGAHVVGAHVVEQVVGAHVVEQVVGAQVVGAHVVLQVVGAHVVGAQVVLHVVGAQVVAHVVGLHVVEQVVGAQVVAHVVGLHVVEHVVGAHVVGAQVVMQSDESPAAAMAEKEMATTRALTTRRLYIAWGLSVWILSVRKLWSEEERNVNKKKNICAIHRALVS